MIVLCKFEGKRNRNRNRELTTFFMSNVFNFVALCFEISKMMVGEIKWSEKKLLSCV